MIFNDTSTQKQQILTNFENYIQHTKEGIPGIQSHRLENKIIFYWFSQVIYMKKFQYLRIILAKISIFFCFCFSETCWHVF